MAKNPKAPEQDLTNDELWELECLQRQFPEHSPEEILWAFHACKSERQDPLSVTKCVMRRLKR